MITIVHGGQTGVDRGAHLAALELDLPIDGYAPMDGRDEEGIIPADVRDRLKLCNQPGMAARTRWNVSISGAVLVIVADEQNPYVTPGTRLTLDLAREMRRTRLVISTSYPIARIDEWLRGVRPSTRLMIAGPRASKWPGGELATLAILRAVTMPR